MSFQAKYPGPCVGECGGRIQPGDWIDAVPGEGHQHASCTNVDNGQTTMFTPPSRNERKCKRCNTIHAGDECW